MLPLVINVGKEREKRVNQPYKKKVRKVQLVYRKGK
jgi:hypothetical protein